MARARYRPRAILEVFRERRYSQPTLRVLEKIQTDLRVLEKIQAELVGIHSTSADCGPTFKRLSTRFDSLPRLRRPRRPGSEDRMTALELAGRTP